MSATVEELGRSSRRAALVSLCGFLVVVGAIGYAMVSLARVEKEREQKAREVQALTEQVASSTRALDSVRAQLTIARASLAAARAAINAFHSGRLEDAVSLYDEALAADPDNAYLQNLRAYALFKLKRIDAAIDGQKRSLAADPSYAWGYFDMARFLCAATPPRLDAAREEARKAIGLRPDMEAIMRSDGEFQTACKHQLP